LTSAGFAVKHTLLKRLFWCVFIECRP